MPVLSASALVAVGALALRNTVCAQTSTMFLGHYHKHDWWGWVRIYAGFLAFTLIVMVGGNVQNPQDLYILGDYDDAGRILYIIYPIECLFFCWIGFMFHKVLSNIQLFQLTEKIPYPLRAQEKPALLVLPDGTYTVRNIAHDRNAPDRNYGVVGLTPSWGQSLLTLFTFLAHITPQVVYDYYVTQTGWNLMAYLTVMIASPGVLLLFAAFCYFVYTDPGTFGLTAKWLRANADKYPLKEEEIALIDGETKLRVLWTILPIAAFSLFGNGLMGGWYLVNPDADRQWLMAVGLWALYAVVLLVIVVTMSPCNNPFQWPPKSVRQIDDSHGYVEQLAAYTPTATSATTTTTAFDTVRQRFGRASDTGIEMKQLVSASSKGALSTQATITTHDSHW